MRYWHGFYRFGFQLRLCYVILACTIKTFIDNHHKRTTYVSYDRYLCVLYTCIIYMLR